LIPQASIKQLTFNIFLAGLTAAMLTGCASTKATNREILVTEKLPRPEHIWVYDFTSSPSDVPAESVLAGRPAEPQTAEQIAEAINVGSEIATELAAQITLLGLPGMVASADT
jgi:hypothetical protein